MIFYLFLNFTSISNPFCKSWCFVLEYSLNLINGNVKMYLFLLSKVPNSLLKSPISYWSVVPASGGRWVLWIYIQRIPVTIKGCFFTWKFQIYFHWCLQYHKSFSTSIIMLFNCIMFLLLWKKLFTMCMWYSLVI